MLRSSKDLRGYTLHATDGDIGTVADFYFDDARWTVRYLVADTGGWLSGRQVLISPLALGAADWQERRLHTTLTREQVEHSPGSDTDQPVSRQHESELARYYRWPYYWGAAEAWGGYTYPYELMAATAAAEADRQEPPAEEEHGDPHLQSVREVTGYRIGARDGAIGHVEDFIVDDQSWAIRYLVVDTRDWLPGKRVLIAPAGSPACVGRRGRWRSTSTGRR